MLKRGEIHVWRVGRARAHEALHAILRRQTAAPLEFAVAEKGKPYLPGAPELKFNLSHSGDMSLIGVALEVEVGVDVERLRPLPEYAAIAERFFPPSQRDPLDECDFFRRWTRIEAMLKARGDGLYGAGAEIPGEWTVEEIDAGDGFAAAVAAQAPGLAVIVHDFAPPDSNVIINQH